MAATLSIFTGRIIEGFVTLAVVSINAAVGFYAERKADRDLEATRMNIRLNACVLRSGRLLQIPFENVVPGDVVDLTPGSRIPADARVIEAHNLYLKDQPRGLHRCNRQTVIQPR